MKEPRKTLRGHRADGPLASARFDAYASALAEPGEHLPPIPEGAVAQVWGIRGQLVAHCMWRGLSYAAAQELRRTINADVRYAR